MPKILLYLLIAFTFTSCAINEVVDLSNPNEIRYSNETDLKGMKHLIEKLKDKTSEKNLEILKNNANKDLTFNEFITFLKTLDLNGNRQNDKFEDLYKVQEELNSLDFMFYRIDYNEKDFKFLIINKANSILDLNNNISKIQVVSEKINAKKQAQFDADLKKLKKKERNSPLVNLMRSQNKSTLISFGNIKYSFDKNIFKKTIDVNQFKESYLPAELDEENRNLLMTMLSQYKVNFKYTFAAPIKNISIKDALFSADRKTFSKEYSLIELLNEPELNNFTVELED
ncbi:MULTISPECIES: hypothetical protein [Empedobacter]|uniref:hypothetical protein n=1 Tax=Empedobacter TaxID=59734 RepID=UPI001C561314|nr:MULTISPECIES: hypothetical protein [Empedobacter]MBW1618715.1 hypothetical protein [Empedobacter falsenii]